MQMETRNIVDERIPRGTTPPDGLCIRPAQPQDVKTLLALIRELALYENRPDAVCADANLLTHWLFSEKAAEVLLCEWQGKPAGYAMFYPILSSFAGRPKLYLEDIFLCEEFRKKGFGKRLLAQVALVAQQRGYAGMQWSCLDWNAESIGFYASLGAVQKTGTLTFLLDEKSTAALAHLGPASRT